MLKTLQIERENTNQSRIEINTDLIKEIKTLFKENWNWNFILTKIEQQILKILYYEKSALNVYEIRRHLIFSTIYHIINQIKEIHQPKEEEKKLKDRLKYHTSKNTKELINRMILDLNLEKYEKYPHFDFSSSQSESLFYLINTHMYYKTALNKFKPIKKQIKPHSDTDNIKLKEVHSRNFYFDKGAFLSNKTEAEALFYVSLRDMNIEIYGCKTISDALDNLVSMRLVLIRELKKGKSKKAFFLNPLILSHIKEESDLNAPKSTKNKNEEVNIK